MGIACITAAGLEEAYFPEARYPGLRFVPAYACKRVIFRRLGAGFFAEMANLKLMAERERRRSAARSPGLAVRLAQQSHHDWSAPRPDRS
jgi:hypothetical protein